MLCVDGMVIIVMDIVFPCPRYLDRRTDRLRQQSGLDDVVGLRLAPECAAEERYVDLYAVDRNPKCLCDFVARYLRELSARPRFASTVGDTGRRGLRLPSRRRNGRCIR